MLKKLKALFLQEEGQGMTEYAIVLGVIAVGAIAVLVAFGGTITDYITETVGKIKTGLSGGTTPTTGS